MTVSVAAPGVWTDGKRHLWWLGTLPMITPLLAGLFALTTGVQVFWWSGVVVIFGLIPMIDGLMGEDASNPPESAVPDLEKQPYYRFIVYSCAVLSVLSLVVTAWMAVSGVDWIIAGGLLQVSQQLHLHGSLANFATFLTERAQLHGSVGWFTYLGMAMSTGAATGIAINIAHELGTKVAGWPSSWPSWRWPRPSTGTSLSSTTAATTCVWPPRKIRPVPALASRSGAFCRAPCGSA